MKKTIKIPWDDFIEYAVSSLRQQYDLPKEVFPKFMISHGIEPDSENYSDPAYVELEIL